MLRKNVDIDLVYQPTIPGPPVQLNQLYEQACTGDGVTISTWRDIWIKNYKATVERFGDLGEKSIGKLYGINLQKPCIVLGSGPSLKHAIPALQENKKFKNPVMSISCLHNFGFFEDMDCHADYYLSLDSGGVVIEDVHEGRNKDGGFYWEKTKGKKLIAAIASDPRLFDLWQGEVYLFNSLVPDEGVRKAFNDIQKMTHYISAGGNAGGACLYAAKSLFGSDPVMFVGLDFCFEYDNTFHSYGTHYDKPGHYVLGVDCFGNQRKTWPSYFNMSKWIEHVACTVPGRWINCSEGLVGSYREGNIAQFEFMPLSDALQRYTPLEKVYLESKNIQTGEFVERREIQLSDYWKNANYEMELTFF